MSSRSRALNAGAKEKKVTDEEVKQNYTTLSQSGLSLREEIQEIFSL
jgi:hypothetical protein